MSRIYQKQGEIRIEPDTESTLHIVAGPSMKRPKVITIESYDYDVDGDVAVDEVDLWVTDIDPLINALLDMKRELINDYGPDIELLK